MPSRDEMADKAVEALHQKYSSPAPPDTVEGPDFRNGSVEGDIADFESKAHRLMQVESLAWLFNSIEGTLIAHVQDCDERKQSLFRLREAMMWANAAVALHQEDGEAKSTT